MNSLFPPTLCPTQDTRHSSPFAVHPSKMNQFVTRVVNWLANEVIVKQLANNKHFQNFALRTHLTVKSTKETLRQHADDIADGGVDGVRRAIENAQSSAVGNGARGGRLPPQRGILGFFSAFGKEVRKDFGGGG